MQQESESSPDAHWSWSTAYMTQSQTPGTADYTSLTAYLTHDGNEEHCSMRCGGELQIQHADYRLGECCLPNVPLTDLTLLVHQD